MVIVQFFRRSLLRTGKLFVGVQRMLLCSVENTGCLNLQQQTDMIRNRAQIRRVLCVAEKNDAAKNIAEIMSSGRARRVSLYVSAVTKSFTISGDFGKFL